MEEKPLTVTMEASDKAWTEVAETIGVSGERMWLVRLACFASLSTTRGA